MRKLWIQLLSGLARYGKAKTSSVSCQNIVLNGNSICQEHLGEAVSLKIALSKQIKQAMLHYN